MSVFVVTFIASFVFIFFKAFQQRNVAFDHYIAVIPTSLLMACAEVYVVYNIAANGPSLGLVLSLGGGSGTGCLLAMLLHKRMFSN